MSLVRIAHGCLEYQVYSISLLFSRIFAVMLLSPAADSKIKTRTYVLPNTFDANMAGAIRIASETAITTDARSNSSVTLAPSSVDYDSGGSIDDFDWRSSTSRKRFKVPWARRRRSEKDDDATRQLGPKGLSLLHRPPEPLIDIIFVHGLRGGSVKTWQKGGDPHRFWPQLWLSVEPGFEHANIHSFGYDADIKTGSCFNIHDFGRELLEEMRISPHLTDNEERPIIMLGHSMGGLVIKKTFILAQDIPSWKCRIKSMFFLATPHRGSNYAALLKNILTVSGTASTRQYIGDLTTSSQTLKLINEDFGKRAHDIAIYSFFETLKTKIGPSSILVVDKESAVLGSGFRNERVKSTAANHCDISKFRNPEEPNYTLIRNALATAVKDLLKDVLVLKADEAQSQMKTLKPYLGISDVPDEHHDTVEGSCEWIESRDDFQDWQHVDSPSQKFANEEIGPGPKDISIFWVHASPGSGKTYLASYVQSQLESTRLQCAYYYFHVGKKTSRSLAPFLRSIAYQMATTSTLVRDKLYKLYQDGSIFDMDDAWTIWTKVFKKGILQIESDVPHYWIIDAIDECPRYAEFFTMLKGEKSHFPLRIFITSRPIRDMHRLQKPLQPTATIYSIDINKKDSLDDIRCYVKTRVEGMALADSSSVEELTSTILRKSNACFLWVRLVIDELEGVFTTVSRMDILNTIPEGMKPYYERAIEPIGANTREKHISKAIFTWVVAVARALDLSELTEALHHDISADVPQSAGAIEGLCGQLVLVGPSNTVGLIHPTAREFLLSSEGEFSVSLPKAHQRIALVCLKLLSENELRPPRTTRSLHQDRPTLSRLTKYAIENFSEHIFAASSENDEVLLALDRFLKTNVFSWIERVAMTGNYHNLLRVCKNLRAYLDRRAKYHSPLSSEVRNIDNWATDLNRLVTQFGEPLLKQPSSIYFLIPPMCPTNTAISRQFGKRIDGLALSGYRASIWDDCIANISFREDVAAAVSCGESVFAVGMESGAVNLYNQRSYQHEGCIRHSHPVDLVHLTDELVVSCTTKAIILQDMQGNIIWEKRIRFRCLYLTASETHVIGVSQHGHLIKWDKGTGEIIEDQTFQYKNYDVETMHNHGKNRAPQVATISPDFEMAALGYRGGTVSIWDTVDTELIGWAKDEEGRVAAKLMFNPNPSIHLLLVVYSNHGLALYDTLSTEPVQAHESPNNAGFLSASCSPDGRTLATTDTHGNMNIWDFETLSILYHILSPFPSFRILSFTSDGSSVLDVMDSNMRVWSPSVLVRKTFEEDASISDDAAHLPVTQGEYERHMDAKINVLGAHPKLPLTVAGKNNGSLVAFATKNGVTSALYKHSGTVTNIAVSGDGTIASADVHNVVFLRKYSPDKGEAVPIKKIDGIKLESRVKQLCFSSSDADPVSAQEQFWLISDRKLERYAAEQFPSAIDSSAAQLCYDCANGWHETELVKAVYSSKLQTLVIETITSRNANTSSAFFVFDTTSVKWAEVTTEELQLHNVLPRDSKHNRAFLGWNSEEKELIFINADSWICSLSLGELKEKVYHRHFYVPRQLCSDLAPTKTANDDIILCNAGEITCTGNGMKFKHADEW
ncbi:hypothetical protein LMH87_005960 [Akanthomyces muscarius]|uniref:GPI inositol-deacylase n=1 Tax=Akanthomyces muscarius TaxID=2231603 RepID=A0A9W8QQ85_AKAMU|nr:hypothetical protein LMH87_005960 [Akanthomyces muscarius]KAJ4164282.1 hypothetical protein LMH87_005960 [Akanthomyces muscarius]